MNSSTKLSANSLSAFFRSRQGTGGDFLDGMRALIRHSDLRHSEILYVEGYQLLAHGIAHNRCPSVDGFRVPYHRDQLGKYQTFLKHLKTGTDVNLG